VSDPLLELARLIGQSDPFGPPPARGESPRRTADLPTRGPMARPPSREVPPPRDRYEADEEREERPARGHPFPALQTFPSRSPRDDHGGDVYSEPSATEAAPAEDEWEAQEERIAQERIVQERMAQERAAQERAARERAEQERIAQEQAAYERAAYERAAQERAAQERAAQERAAHERFEFPAVGGLESGRAPRGRAAHADEVYPTVPDQHYPAESEPMHPEDGHYPQLGRVRAHQDAYLEEEGHQGQYADAGGEQYDDEYADGEDGAYAYDDEEPKRRNTIKIALAALGVVVLGTAAAFGYRTVFHSGTDGPPPLIRADNSPTKVVPTPSTADAGSKPINDRLGSGERMASREEQPIDLRDAARGALVGPAGGSTGVAPYPAAPAASATAPAAAPAATEPKRVRTVTIHADTPPANGVVPPGAGPATSAAAPPASAAPRPATARPPAVPRPAAAAPSQPTAPMALTPQSQPQPQSQPTMAAVEPARPATPARAAPTGTGGWIVQLSAQKSEAEAQSAFRAAQAKYSALASYQPLIRKKDYGERGVFYASQVGPVAREEANQLCETIKGAGGNCFIQKY
jgi:hypothetical protein